MYTVRPRAQGIVFVGNYEPGKATKSSIEPGDSVTLKIGDEHVIVRDINVIGEGRYEGIIHGFEPSCDLTYQGLRVEQKIEFEESNIFGCHCHVPNVG